LAVKTAADRRLANNDSVLRMLKWIDLNMTRRKPRLPSRSSSSFLEHLGIEEKDEQAPSSA